MSPKLFFLILLFVFIASCGLIFNSGIDRSVSLLHQGIVPDSCDLQLIDDFIDFREDSLRFPTQSWAVRSVQTQAEICRTSIDSVNIFSYGNDFSDLFLIMHYTNRENERYSIRKYYRFRFANDTLYNVTPYLITSKDEYY